MKKVKVMVFIILVIMSVPCFAEESTGGFDRRLDMGVLDAAMHADRMKRQGFQDIRDAMGQITETNKAMRFKKAGKMLFDLGGLSQENLKKVVNTYDLDPEQTKELITTWAIFYKTMAEMEGKN